ncbi:MAG TPA: hypothetical protein VE954_21275 [Oligoflexus sp.]|uniref:hypothetical protein n=1 Tax=Oligoflexus sp. TaxID=1971216 RepID=UPI002D565E8D|nr:hypothetical protein [Oligoflexus sp.]HYX35637.1 hypothetical protein [Oligoflexus sp.]
MTNKNQHFIFVDQWIDDSLGTLPREALLNSFQQALIAVWCRAQQTLGQITLLAVGDRVAYLAQESFPWLSSVQVETSGIMLKVVPKELSDLDQSNLLDGLRFLLGEFLSVLHELTAGVISAQLKAAVLKSTTHPMKASSVETMQGKSALDKRART